MIAQEPPRPPDAQPAADVRARVLATVKDDPVPTRAEGQKRRAVFASLAMLALAAGSLAAARPGLGARPAGYVATLALAWAAIGAVATWASLSRGRSMLGRTRAWHVAVAAATPLALLGAALAAGALWPPVASSEGVRAGAQPLVCFGMTLGLSVGPFVVVALLYGAMDPVSPRLTAASLAAAAGAWGAVVIELHCGVPALSHVMAGHVLPVVAAVLGGFAAGRLVAIPKGTFRISKI